MRRCRSVLASTLVLALAAAALAAAAAAFALPLAGCARAGRPTAAGAGSAGSGQPAGEPGQDPAFGRELGPWGDWDASLAPGQHYRYSLNTVTDGRLTTGWYQLDLSDAGNGRLRVDYAGSVGDGFSGSFVAETPSTIDWADGITYTVARAALVGLLVTPRRALGLASHSWEPGASWSLGEGANRISFAITAKRSFAGITGALGVWKDAAGQSCEFCVNPNVPLALYLKLLTDERNYVEYTLVECGGF